MIKNFNNKTEKVGDDLKNTIKKGSKLDIAASIFSIYVFESLKSELRNIDELRFIFTDPTFIELDKKKTSRKIILNSKKLRSPSLQTVHHSYLQMQ